MYHLIYIPNRIIRKPRYVLGIENDILKLLYIHNVFIDLINKREIQNLLKLHIFRKNPMQYP